MSLTSSSIDSDSPTTKSDRRPRAISQVVRTGTPWLDTAATIALLAVALHILSGFAPDYILPGLDQIAIAIGDLPPSAFIATFLRVAAALVAAFLIAALLAVIAYTARTVERFLLPIVRVLMAVPAVSWVILSILWFRNPETRIFVVLLVASVPNFIFDLLDAMRGVDKNLRYLVRSFRPTHWQYFRMLILPAISPAVFTTWKINLSLTIRLVTFAELVGAVSGLGFRLNQAKALFRIADVFAITIILIVWLVVAQGAVIFLEKRFLKWRDER